MIHPSLIPSLWCIRKEKKIRICIDARKINQFTEPDRERVAPMHELLQRFNGARFMTSLDLTSAYLQVPLHEESRKYTAFLFDSACYQYKRVPYGFRNSLAGFVRALKLALGNGTDEYTVFYCDDILVYSKTFDEHLTHLDTVIRRLTEAGFTLNASKCLFCRAEVTFLGHRIDERGVSPDPDRIAAILHYPMPRNSKRTRQRERKAPRPIPSETPQTLPKKRQFEKGLIRDTFATGKLFR